MIRPININLNAAHPELPLVEATTFTGAPSSVFIRGVPKAVGNWSITAVSVAVTYPDNTTTARAAVESAEGVWVATIPGTATSGRTAAGFKIMADGIDENGAAVTGYVLGFADFSVLSFMPVPAPGGTFYFLRFFDQAPATPKEGDMAKIDGVLKFYNGSAWEPFAAPVTLDNTVTRTSANGVKSSGIWSALWGALSALPTGFSSLYDWCVSQLAGKASTADVTLNKRGTNHDGFSDWFVTPVYPSGYTSYTGPTWVDAQAIWVINFTGHPDDPDVAETAAGRRDSLSLEFLGGTTATRTVLEGYMLGDQYTKPLASEAEAVALRTGKMSASATGADILVGGSGGAASSSIASAINDLFRVKADLDSPTFTGTPVAPTPQDGENSTLIATTAFVQGAVPYALVTKTITNGAVSLDDRAINAVAVSSSLASLTVNFPTATSGKARDFGLRLTVASGITTAPELALPQGVTCENADGEAPEIGADGAATILYFTETASGVFLVKGEVVQTIS